MLGKWEEKLIDASSMLRLGATRFTDPRKARTSSETLACQEIPCLKEFNSTIVEIGDESS